MAKLWGPLGWMTLHSVSLIYPENPTPEEQKIASRFLNAFAETISCPTCKSHFGVMYAIYSATYPGFLKSRQTFATFVFRAHNTVNKRLDKPFPKTISECISTLKTATSQTSFKQFRAAYLAYLNKNWGREHGGDAAIARVSVKELQTITSQYWDPRDDGTIPELEESDVLELIEAKQMRVAGLGRVISTRVGFKGGKLRLG